MTIFIKIFPKIMTIFIKIFPKIMTISTDLAILNSMSSFVPKFWLNWQILVAICNEFRRQRWVH